MLVDGFGNIHYGLLIRSALEKGQKKRDGMVDIVSNESRGGQAILLNGERVEDPINRKVLVMHDIDPDEPRIPKLVATDGSRVGRVVRGHYPLVGVDFMYNQNCKNLYLEFNARPGLEPEEFGLTQQDTDRVVNNPGNKGEVREYLEILAIREMFKAR